MLIFKPSSKSQSSTVIADGGGPPVPPGAAVKDELKALGERLYGLLRQVDHNVLEPLASSDDPAPGVFSEAFCQLWGQVHHYHRDQEAVRRQLEPVSFCLPPCY